MISSLKSVKLIVQRANCCEICKSLPEFERKVKWEKAC